MRDRGLVRAPGHPDADTLDAALLAWAPPSVRVVLRARRAHDGARIGEQAADQRDRPRHRGHEVAREGAECRELEKTAPGV